MNHDYKSAQQHINKILNTNLNIRLDIQSGARVINLVIEYELGEYEHVGYLLRSTYHYLLKKQRLDEPENIILDFIKAAIKLSSEKQALEALKKLKTQLTPYFMEPFLLNFPLIEWIDSKLQKKPLAEIVKQQYLEAIAAEEESVAT